MFKILTLNKISPLGLDRLPASDYEILEDTAQDSDAVLVRSASMLQMDFGKNLKAIARAGAGVNNIPVDRCSEEGIVVFNTPGANANAVKELVVAGLLLSSRKIVDGINWAQALAGNSDVAKLVEKGKSEFVGPELLGKRIGVIGLGAIGVLVANACNSLGMEVMGFDPFISVDSAWHLSRSIKKAASLDMIFETSDYITLHIPLGKETKHMINDDVLSKVHPGVRILNFSRGELVDNEAMKKALADGRVNTYVTDFPTEELLGVKNILTVPHLGASTPESEDNCAVMAAKQLKRFLEEGNIVNSVNLPDCEMPPTGRTRICVIHRNIPNVVGPVTTVVAKRSINIDNMMNKSKGAYAYTMLDVDNGHVSGPQGAVIVDELLNIEGVIKVRVI